MPTAATLTPLLAQVQTNGGGFAFAAFPCVLGLIGLGLFVLWLYALIDAIKNPALDSNQRLIWILVIIFTSPIGPILYLLIGRK